MLTRVARPGPVALGGSGEYLPAMLELEAALIAGRSPKYVQLPTAAGPEGPASVSRGLMQRYGNKRRSVDHHLAGEPKLIVAEDLVRAARIEDGQSVEFS